MLDQAISIPLLHATPLPYVTPLNEQYIAFLVARIPGAKQSSSKVLCWRLTVNLGTDDLRHELARRQRYRYVQAHDEANPCYVPVACR